MSEILKGLLRVDQTAVGQRNLGLSDLHWLRGHGLQPPQEYCRDF